MGTIIFCIVFGCIGLAFFPLKEIKEKNYVGAVFGAVFFLAFSGTGFVLATVTASDMIQGVDQTLYVKGVIEEVADEKINGYYPISIGNLELKEKYDVKEFVEGEMVYIEYYPYTKAVKKVYRGEAMEKLEEKLEKEQVNVQQGQINVTEGGN